MKSYALVFLVLLATAVSSCATSGQTTLLGSGIGALLGGSIGALVNAGPKGRGRTQNIFVGASIGSLAGGTAGLLLHDAMATKGPESTPSKDEAQSASSLLDPRPTNSSHPVLVPPKVETRYVDDQIRGNVFVPGHLEYQITEPGRWSR